MTAQLQHGIECFRRRPLGVAVRRIAVWQDARLRVIDADDPALSSGLHAFEIDNGFRWTSGDAVLPRQVLAGFSGPLRIALTVASTTHYLDEGERLPVA